MTTSRLLRAAATALALLFLVILGARVIPRLGPLGDIAGHLIHAEGHQGPTIRCGGLVLQAEHNMAVIERAAEYVSTLGPNTSMYLQIAQRAADADHECPRLEAVLDLAVRMTSGGGLIYGLADGACGEFTDDEAGRWQEQFDTVAAMATYATVEEAVAAQRME